MAVNLACLCMSRLCYTRWNHLTHFFRFLFVVTNLNCSKSNDTCFVFRSIFKVQRNKTQKFFGSHTSWWSSNFKMHFMFGIMVFNFLFCPTNQLKMSSISFFGVTWMDYFFFATFRRFALSFVMDKGVCCLIIYEKQSSSKLVCPLRDKT